MMSHSPLLFLLFLVTVATMMISTDVIMIQSHPNHVLWMVSIHAAAPSMETHEEQYDDDDDEYEHDASCTSSRRNENDGTCSRISSTNEEKTPNHYFQ
jgi:hypothetical protein